MVKGMIVFTVPRTVLLLWPGSIWENNINLVGVCRTGSWETIVIEELKMSKPHNANTVSFVLMESPCTKVFSHFCYSVCEAVQGQVGIRLLTLKVPVTEDLHYVLFLSITAASAGNSGHPATHRKSKSETFSKYIKVLSLPPHVVVTLPPSISAYFIFTSCIPTTYPL